MTIENEKSLQRFAIALPVLLLVISVLMVSTIRYPSFKRVDWHTKTTIWTFLAVLIGGVLIYKLQEIAFLVLFLSYLLFGMLRYVRRRWFGRPRPIARKNFANNPPTKSQ